LDQNYGLEDIHSSTIAAMIKDCERFQEENRELLEASGQSEAQSGHDFWLTREGHGSGFWDRGLGEVGEQLTTICENVWGCIDLYVGDDGQIYSLCTECVRVRRKTMKQSPKE